MTSGDACPTREELITKTKTLQMPFIANNGQMDEQVAFYAKTFGGTVFVTKGGEIVYSLPKGSEGVEAGERRGGGAGAQGGKLGKLGAVRQIQERGVIASLFALDGYPPLLRDDYADSKSGRVLTNALLAAYLPGLQGSADTFVGTRRPCPPRLAPLPGSQTVTDKQGLPIPINGNANNYTLQYDIQNSNTDASGVAIVERLVGGKVNEIKGDAQSVTTVSYFKGNDPSKWKSNLSTYQVVDMGEVYKGVGLKLKAYGNNVEKLFTVRPDATPEAIKLGLSGAKALKVNDEGQLVAETELGPVKFTKPIAYQEIDGKRVDVAVDYMIHGAAVEEDRGAEGQGRRGEPETRYLKLEPENPKLTYGFIVASYDKTKDIVIDPLLASTFLGGSGWDGGYYLTLDTSGNVYVTGETWSTDFPTTSGAYDTSYNGGAFYDVFVSKLDSGLTGLLASTFLGGSDYDRCTSLTLDTSGNVYVAGVTGSTDFPTTSGAYDTSYGGGDAFVSKLDSGLTSLLASTFLGGSDRDEGDFLTLDTSGNVYVTGVTWSTDFPTTSGAYDISFNGSWDVFVSKLDGNLSANVSSCKSKTITAAPKKLTLSKNGNGDVTITVKGAGNCLVEGATVTATISGNGNQIIDISPGSQETDANGQAVFAIDAKDKKGTAVIRFRASGLGKSTTAQVKVR